MHRFLEWHVSQYMTRNVEAIPPSMTLQELGALFEHHHHNSFPVAEGDICIGLVTKFDFLKAFVFNTRQIVPHYQELMARTASTIMTKDFAFVDPDESLTRALELMIGTMTPSLPVLAPGRKFVGIISLLDLTRALHDAAELSPHDKA